MHSLPDPSAELCLKLIQITDCHLLANPEAHLKQVSPWQSLRQVCAAVRRKHGNANALLLTGDLSQDGSPASYTNLLDAISDLKLDTYAVAGNHDCAELLHSMLQPKSLPFGHWHLLLLHSPVANEVYGMLAEAELLWLRQQLDAFPDQYFLIALHHQPVPVGGEWINEIGLRNAVELETLLTNHPQVRVLIHGHTHQAGCYDWQHIACYGTPSSWRQFVSNSPTHRMDFLPPAYRVIELYNSGAHRSWIEFAYAPQ
jgi:Icc protein